MSTQVINPIVRVDTSSTNPQIINQQTTNVTVGVAVQVV